MSHRYVGCTQDPRKMCRGRYTQHTSRVCVRVAMCAHVSIIVFVPGYVRVCIRTLETPAQ